MDAAVDDVDRRVMCFVLQLLTCGSAVAQQMLQNGLPEVLCNVIHCLHETSSAVGVVNVVHSDVERLFSAVARVTCWYVHVLCQFNTSSHLLCHVFCKSAFMCSDRPIVLAIALCSC